ncbi:MAG: redoxin domain-containing protein [Fibromonadaceae bacterium]|jgi:thiol-disulfide isomerase/thioredoxin|nr:redoxin domain-containing protein [Fibromonadaceae bacterium]
MEKRTSTLDGKMKKILVMLLAISPLFAEPSVRLPLPPPLQKKQIPTFVARDKNAKELFNLRDLKKSVNPNAERVALAYFATWCIPCMEGMVRLKNNSDLLEKNKVQIVLVNFGETRSCLGSGVTSVECQEEVKIVHEWIKKYSNPEWLLIMDINRQLVKPFGLSSSEQDMPLPQTLLLDNKLKPLLLLSTEGNDWPQVLWEELNQ